VERPAPPLTGASPSGRGPGVARGPGESPRADIRIRGGASFCGTDARLALSLRSFLVDQRPEVARDRAARSSFEALRLSPSGQKPTLLL
jgi:hypothetical protein